MLCSVKNESFAVDTHGSDDVWILWHVASFVDFAWVVDLLVNVELDALLGRAIAADFFAIWVVFGCLGLGLIGIVDVCYLQVVLSFSRSVCAKDESVCREVPSWYPEILSKNIIEIDARYNLRLYIRKPLRSESWPFEGAATTCQCLVVGLDSLSITCT